MSIPWRWVLFVIVHSFPITSCVGTNSSQNNHKELATDTDTHISDNNNEYKNYIVSVKISSSVNIDYKAADDLVHSQNIANDTEQTLLRNSSQAQDKWQIANGANKDYLNQISKKREAVNKASTNITDNFYTNVTRENISKIDEPSQIQYFDSIEAHRLKSRDVIRTAKSTTDFQSFLGQSNPELVNNKQTIQHPVVYSKPAKVYGEPAKFYSEPAKIYSEPAKIYSEPAKIYGEPAKIYSEPAKFYSKPASVYHNVDLKKNPLHNMFEAFTKNRTLEKQTSYLNDSSSYQTTPENSEINNTESTEKMNQTDEQIRENCKEDNCKVGYVVEGRQFRKYRVEERTPDGFIVGEYGVVRNEDGHLRGVRYTADSEASPRLIQDALMRFLQL